MWVDRFAGRLNLGRSVWDAFTVFVNNGFILVGGFLTSVMLARALGPADRGLLALILVYPEMLVGFLQMGVRQSTVYEVGRARYTDDTISGTVCFLFCITSTLGFICCYILLRYFSDDRVTLAMCICGALIVPLSLVKAYAGGYFLGKQKIGLSNRIAWLPVALRLLLVIVLVEYLGLGIFAALCTTVIALLPSAVYTLKMLSREVCLKIRWNPEVMRSMITLGLVYALAMFLSQLNYRVNLLMLQSLSNAEQLGLYTVSGSFAQLIWQVPNALGLVLFSRSANSKGSKAFTEKVVKVFKGVFIISGLGGVLLILLAPYFMPALYGDDYLGSVAILQIMTPGIVAMVGYKILVFDLAGKGKPWLGVIVSLPPLLLNIALSFWLIPIFGGAGAAVASCASYVLMSLFAMLVYDLTVQKAYAK